MPQVDKFSTANTSLHTQVNEARKERLRLLKQADVVQDENRTQYQSPTLPPPSFVDAHRCVVPLDSYPGCKCLKTL